MSWIIIRALLHKYSIIWFRNGFRTADFIFFPVIDLLVWGFVTNYMLRVSHALPGLVTFFIAAIIFWNVLLRAQQVICLSVLDDVWSRNLLNMFTAPVRISEYIVACYLMGLVQAVFVLALQAIIAYFVCSFNFLTIGLYCPLLFLNILFTGWSIGLFTTGLIIRFGQSAEMLTWVMPFFIQPLSAVFYPVSVLPPWLQPIALCLPPTHVFEGMRQVISTGQMDWYHLQYALLLNIIYMIISGFIFHYLFESAREKGSLTKYCT